MHSTYAVLNAADITSLCRFEILPHLLRENYVCNQLPHIYGAMNAVCAYKLFIYFCISCFTACFFEVATHIWPFERYKSSLVFSVGSNASVFPAV